jgi:hypothetical protein
MSLEPRVVSPVRASRAVAAAAAAILLAVSAAAQPAPARAGAGTATRAVASYAALEARFADLVASADRKGLEALIAEDFAYLAPAADPLDRAAYLAAELARPAAAERIYGLTVVEGGEIDLVSFLVRLRRHEGPRRGLEIAYVVDAWRRADHRLASRHRSIPSHAPPAPDRPTGRE